jgi:hypothetical protein
MTDESTSLTWDVHVAPPEPLQRYGAPRPPAWSAALAS